MIGIDLVKNRKTREKFDVEQGFAKKVSELTYQNGLPIHILWTSDIISLSPSLIINETETESVINILGQAIYQEYKNLVN